MLDPLTLGKAADAYAGRLARGQWVDVLLSGSASPEDRRIAEMILTVVITEACAARRIEANAVAAGREMVVRGTPALELPDGRVVMIAPAGISPRDAARSGEAATTAARGEYAR